MKTGKRRGPSPIGEAIQVFLRDAGLGLGAREAGVFRAWKDALDGPAREGAVPVRFRQGKLLVEVASSALLQELSSFGGEDARRRANALLGKPLIRRVVFKSRG